MQAPKITRFLHRSQTEGATFCHCTIALRVVTVETKVVQCRYCHHLREI